MIVYMNDKSKFVNDVVDDNIDDVIERKYKEITGHRVSDNEKRSWRNSLLFMKDIVHDQEIPNDSGIAIEFHIPRSSNRVDFIITGKDANEKRSVVIVELKQWEKVTLTEKDGIVNTYVGGRNSDHLHPSYQAWSYAALMSDFNEAIEKDNIQLKPCAYLHNCDQPEIIRNDFYKEYTDLAPAFLKSDKRKLKDFIRQHIKHGDKGETLYRIEHGVIKPSKNLADALSGLLKGKREFTLIDEQKLVYETAISLTDQAKKSIGKRVLIVNGGPGTGKTVVAINLLVKLTEKEYICQYVSKNSAPREVYKEKLTGSMKPTRFDNLFTGSGSFHEAADNTFGALIVDEAHRLNAKSGMFNHLGENQIKEIIKSARCSIFFLDEDQRISFLDIGSKDEINKWAKEFHVPVEELTLKSQFRCNGADGYLAWLDNTLAIRKTANLFLDDTPYDFKVSDSAEDLKRLIYAKNEEANSARMVAGYCWSWASKKDSKAMDITIGTFQAQWNLTEDGSKWIIKKNSVSEVGCIHTCQGLELDYIGVIIGPDLIVRDGEVITRGEQRDRHDKTMKGFKSQLKAKRKETLEKADAIIKNTYRTLMTRGMKGCYVFSTDPETNQYLKDRMKQTATTP